MINYEHKLSRVKKGGKNSYQAFVRHISTVSRADFAEELAKTTGFTPEIANLFMDAFATVLGKCYREGCRVDLGELRAGIAVHGSVADPLTPWARSGLKFTPYLMPAGRLRKCLKDVQGKNMTEGASIVIDGLLDKVHAVNMSIIGKRNVKVGAIGAGLDIDPSAPDEGVWLENESGRVVARGEVIDSTYVTLDVTFAELPPSGRYRFVVSGRSGDPTLLGPRRAKRWVTVKRR